MILFCIFCLSDTSGSTKDVVIGALRLLGGVLALVILLLPVLCIWSFGNVEDTLRLQSKLNLGCTALSCYGWLAYSVLQVNFKDSEEINGIDAIIINGFSWGFIGFLLLVVLLFVWEIKGMVCLIGLAVHIVLTIGILQFPVFKWVKKESKAKLIIGIIAALFQNFAEIIPIIKLISSVVRGGLSLISICAHCAWAVKPRALNGLNQVLNPDERV